MAGRRDGPGSRCKVPRANRFGKRSWKTVATVVAADPGREFSFRVSSMGLQVADWGYAFTPTDKGCSVTETWEDRRAGFFKPIAGLATGVGDRASHNRAGMEQTLEALAKAAESTTSS